MRPKTDTVNRELIAPPDGQKGWPPVSPTVLIVAALSVLVVAGLTVTYRVPRHVRDIWWWNTVPLVYAGSVGTLLFVRRRRWMAAVAVAVVVGGLGGSWPWGALAMTTVLSDVPSWADRGVSLLFWVYFLSLVLLIGVALRERAKSNDELSTLLYLLLTTALAVSLQAAWAVRVFGG